ncbi:MAG TPA: alpha-ketoglutarate-dependent dioxygenase AlkB [Flavobacteriales bacterium]|nr:alpha-ketoglutarate-dependent dioxygenase AlkB [Flavobacteriales bacterium]
MNLLPQDGCVNYWGKVFSETESLKYYEIFMHEIDWRNDEAFIYGKHYITKRKVAWYGDQAYPYSYSGKTRIALAWTQTLLVLKQKAEKLCDCEFNSCLLNLYPSGEEGMAWHSDDEPSLQKHSEIASFSFGAERKFAFKHKTLGIKVELRLENGSLLLMKESTQTHWRHRLPPTKKINSPRINLTFRKMK